jgi:putative ABC transport system substrate-binding protein
MQRREFITLIGGASVAWPFSARAQQPERMRRIGMLIGLAEDDPESHARLAAFRQSLRELGWTEGHNVRFDYRWAAADPARIRAYTSELVGMTPDVIMANSDLVLAALHLETSSVPIVFVQVGNPVGIGLVGSLARPGGNITGFASNEAGLAGKWLELLKEISPSLRRVVVIHNQAEPQSALYLSTVEAAAPKFAVQLILASVNNAAEIEYALDEFAREPNGGLIVLPSLITAVHRELIVAAAARHRLPAVYPFRYFIAAGGLLSYGVDPIDLYRRAGGYVDRILRGAKPADLPVQQPTKFEFVINLKIAKALGLTVPLTLQASADEVIE